MLYTLTVCFYLMSGPLVCIPAKQYETFVACKEEKLHARLFRDGKNLYAMMACTKNNTK